MNSRQRDKARDTLALKLSTQYAARDTANAQGNEVHFYAMCDAIRATEAEIQDLDRPSRKRAIDGATAVLISANAD